MLARLNELRTTDGELRRGWASSMSQLGELQDARDWRGIVARERTLLALARGRQDNWLHEMATCRLFHN